MNIAKEQFEKASKTLDDSSLTPFSNFLYLILRIANLELGDYQNAQRLAEKSRQLAEASNDETGKALALGQIGIALGLSTPSRFEQAEKMLDDAYAEVDRLGLRALYAWKSYAYGRLYAYTNQKERAMERREELRRSIRDMEEMQMGYWLVRGREFLAKLTENIR
jgi:tetratricopeptide (TPR) repeat protein